MFYKIFAWVTNALNWLESKLFRNVGQKIMRLSILAAVVLFGYCIYVGGKTLVDNWKTASNLLENYEDYKDSETEYGQERWKYAKERAAEIRWDSVKELGLGLALAAIASYVAGLLYYGLGALIDRARQYCDIKRQTNEILRKLLEANMGNVPEASKPVAAEKPPVAAEKPQAVPVSTTTGLNTWFCPMCGQKNDGGTLNCKSCGHYK